MLIASRVYTRGEGKGVMPPSILFQVVYRGGQGGNASLYIIAVL